MGSGGGWCTAGPDLNYARREYNGNWGGLYTLVSTPIVSCSAVRLADDRAFVSYPDAPSVVTVATSGVNGGNPWTTEIVDATSSFAKPSLAVSSINKLYVLYQAVGYLKLARQQ